MKIIFCLLIFGCFFALLGCSPDGGKWKRGPNDPTGPVVIDYTYVVGCDIYVTNTASGK